MFVPYTFFYIKAFKPKLVWQKCLMLSLATTLFIEVFQLLFWVGWFSLADIVHNVVGGMLGCGLWKLIEFYKKRKISMDMDSNDTDKAK